MPAATVSLIDGSGFIYRAFHALPDMTRADGTHVNAVYGFCAMLNKTLGDRATSHVAVVFDAGRTTFRTALYPAYKAHRPPPPPELVPQFALIREATRAYGVAAIEEPGFEADDLIAAYVRKALEAGLEARVISSDKDLMQLIRPGVTMMDPLKGTLVGPNEVEAKFGVAPEKVVDVQALVGDSVDNVPGVPGIGVKTAAELIRAYGDLESLLAAAPTLKQPKRREALVAHADQARLSKRLVTLDSEAPCRATLESLHAQPPDRAALGAFLEAQGFRSLVARLERTEGSPHPNPPLQELQGVPASATEEIHEPAYVCVQKLDDLRPWIDEATAQGFIAVDTETTSLTPSTTRLVGISLATAPGRACYIPITHKDPAAPDDEGGLALAPPVASPTQIPLPEVVQALRPLFANPSVLKIGHNLKFDSQALGQQGLAITSFDDTMLMSYALGAGLHGHGLDELTLRFFQHKMIAFSDVTTGPGTRKVTFDRVPLIEATAYAAEDADWTLRLWQTLKPRLVAQHVTRVYERLDRPLVPIVAAMERWGIRINPTVLTTLSASFGRRLAALEGEIHALVGHPFLISSPKQLGVVLFEEQGIPGGVKGKTGAYSTGHEVLEPLAESGNVLATKVLEWRALAKLMSTYTEALVRQIDSATGRAHTSFVLTGAATGRLSSSDPNVQNIPVRTEDGRAIRKAFIADEGFVLLSADYSQIELRLAAEVSGAPALLGAFREGHDIHALTASQVFGVPLAEVSADQRRAAKAVNFGILYGISGFGLAKQLGGSPAEAQAFIRQYLDRLPEVKTWMEGIKTFARTHGYVLTPFGRQIHIQGLQDKNPARRAFAERQAINAPLQGAAADIIKRAMIHLPPALQAAGLGARMLLQVHDELVFEVPQGEVSATAELIKRVMEEAPLPVITLQVPLVVTTGVGPSWAEAH